MLHHADVTAAIVIGYGPASLVTPVLDTLTPRLRAATIDVFDALRVTGRRYYSYLCQNPHCCPIDGRPCDPDRTNLTLHAIVAGHTALPDRQALVTSIAPSTDPPAPPSPAPPTAPGHTAAPSPPTAAAPR